MSKTIIQFLREMADDGDENAERIVVALESLAHPSPDTEGE